MNIGDIVTLTESGRRCMAFSIKRYGEPGSGMIVRFNSQGNPVVLWETRKCPASISPDFIKAETKD